MKLFAYLIVAIFLTFTVGAQERYFDFTLPGNFIVIGKPFSFNLTYFLSSERERNFVIKPILKNGSMEIFNFEKNSWVNDKTSIYEFPIIHGSLKAKVTNLPQFNSTLYFQISDLKTGKIYLTEEKKVWSNFLYSTYVNSLNRSKIAK